MVWKIWRLPGEFHLPMENSRLQQTQQQTSKGPSMPATRIDRKLIIATNNPGLGAAIAAAVESQGVARVVLRPSGGGHYGLGIGANVPGTWVHQLMEAIHPLQPNHLTSHDPDALDPLLDDAKDADAVLQLPDWLAGDKLPEIDLQANSESFMAKATEILARLPHRKFSQRAHHVPASEIRPARGIPKQWVETACFLLAREGISVQVIHPDPEEEERPWKEKDLRVTLADPGVLAASTVSRYPVLVRSDETELAGKLVKVLRSKGFRAETGTRLFPGEVADTSITLKPGPLNHEDMEITLATLNRTIREVCRSGGIDMDRYPLQTDTTSDRFDVVLLLPASACLAGTARSTGGDHPDRFRVRIKTDLPTHPAVRHLVEELEKAGFRSPETDLVTSIIDCPTGRFRGGRVVRDFRLVSGALEHAPESRAKLVSLLAEAKASLDPLGKSPMTCDSPWQPDDPDVFLHLPVKGVEDGKLGERLRRTDLYPVKLIAIDLPAWHELATDLVTAGFHIADRDSVATEGPFISYGAAPEEVIATATRLVRAACGRVPRLRREFSEEDHDIYIHLPEKPVKRKTPTKRKTGDSLSTQALLTRREEPFLKVDATGATIAGIRLERRGAGRHDAMVPHPAQFSHFCVDQSAAPTLRHLALSVRLGEPCLLEGETSTAKTSSIQYLASVLGQPVVRVNLNGQSDTGELIGRFVPATGSRASGGAQWSWQDGVLLEALRHGWWVILDELNLAEPAILERLNSLLERAPSLLVTEHDNRLFGPGGEPIHPEFRIFGTMNPAEYAGRNALSPAYRDRWRGHLFVRTAGESEYRAMLRQMIFGERPRVCVDGVLYGEPGPVEPTHGELAGMPGMDDFIDALARFQASLDAACRRGKDGEQALSHRKERPVFTRRGLIALLDHLGSPAHADRELDCDQLRQEALNRYFLARFSCEEELTVVRQLIQASGLNLVGGAA